MNFNKSPIAFIDHYDSFSRNVLGWLEAANADRIQLLHIYCDDIDSIERLYKFPIPLVLSPGPKAPCDNLYTMRLIDKWLGRCPILGVCLGHQMLASAFGAKIEKSLVPRHGATRTIKKVNDEDLLVGMPATFRVAAYNSLTVAASILNQSEVTLLATCEHHEIQSLRFMGFPDSVPAYGVQFHPESFISESCEAIAEFWIASVVAWQSQRNT